MKRSNIVSAILTLIPLILSVVMFVAKRNGRNPAEELKNSGVLPLVIALLDLAGWIASQTDTPDDDRAVEDVRKEVAA